jgi:hypothetical protein
MIIPIFWREKAKIQNLPELLENYGESGGVIVEYQRIFSIIIFSRMSPVYEWVPPGTSRRAAGRKHAMYCFFLGWWSIMGLFGTAGAIINNLMGGIDVTKILTMPPPLPGQPYDNAAIRELNEARKRQGYGFLIFLAVVLVLVLILVWPYMKQP